MSRLKSNHEWLTEILPEGLKYPSSTIISGAGGTGKPLIGFGIVDDWLKAGGNVIFAPLQYPKTDFVRQSLKELHNMTPKITMIAYFTSSSIWMLITGKEQMITSSTRTC